MIIRIDKRIYSDNCIAKAVYSLSDIYVIQRTFLSDKEEIIDIVPKQSTTDESIKDKFLCRLNDYKLRSIVEEETHEIRTILYAKAFSDCNDIEATDMDE